MQGEAGTETQPETAASRFVWGVGYFTYDCYFPPSIVVQELPEKLKRGDQLRLPGGAFANVRLKRAAKGDKKEGGEIYTVSDLGASFGTDHLVKSHEKGEGNLESFRKSGFITKKTGSTVSFATPGHPSAIFCFHAKKNHSRAKLEALGRDIPIADARSMGEQLGLSPAQIRDDPVAPTNAAVWPART